MLSLDELIPGYLDSCLEKVVDLETALSQGALRHMERIGHNLKGTGQSYGFEEVSRIGESIECAARSASVALLPALVRSLRSYLEDVRENRFLQS